MSATYHLTVREGSSIIGVVRQSVRIVSVCLGIF